MKFVRLFVCLLFALLYVNEGYSQVKQNYTIGMMLDSKTGETQGFLNRLKNEIQAVVGEDAIFTLPEASVLVNNFSVEQASANYQRLLKGDVDMIIAVGLASNLALQDQKEYRKPTILFGSLNTDVNHFDVNQTTSGVTNFTYLMGVESFKGDLETFKELTDFKNVGIAIEEGISETLPLDQAFNDILGNTDASFKILPFKTIDDIASNLQGLDALYLAGGRYFNDDEIRILGEFLIEKGIASFTITGPGDVALGLMATNSSDENVEQVIRRIALTIEAYVSGSDLSDQKVFIDFENRLTTNYNTMQKLGVPIRYSLIAKTDFVGNLQNQLSEKNYTLTGLIADILERNLFLQSQQKDVDLAQQDVKIANSNYYPDVSVNASFVNNDERVARPIFSPEFTTDGNIRLNQTLFSAAANANIRINKNLQRAQQANFSAAELDAVLEASNLYFNALINKVNVKIQNQNLQLTKENLRIAKQNYEAGQSGKSDMLRFESQVAQNTQTLIEASNQLRKAFIAINQLLNNPIDFELDVVEARLGQGVFEEYNYEQLAELLDNPQLTVPFVAFLIEEAKINSPELASLDFNLKAVERTFSLNSFGRILPTVTLQANYNQNFNQWGTASLDLDPDNNYNVGVNLTLPILNRFRTNINRQTARIQMDQLEINKKNTELAIESNIHTAVLNITNQISNIRLSEVAVKAAKESLELVQTSYSEGAVSIIQLIDAQNNYLQAQLAQASATYEFLLNTIQMERFMGYNFLLHTKEENDAFRQRFTLFLEEDYQQRN